MQVKNQVAVILHNLPGSNGIASVPLDSNGVLRCNYDRFIKPMDINFRGFWIKGDSHPFGDLPVVPLEKEKKSSPPNEYYCERCDQQTRQE